MTSSSPNNDNLILVYKDKEHTTILKDTFIKLTENTIASHYSAYSSAIKTNKIKLDDLVDISRKTEIPYPLFFSPLPLVKYQVENKWKKMLKGLSKETLAINTRECVNIGEIELILKDLTRKQQELKRLDKSLATNPIVGCIKKSKDVEESATTLTNHLALDMNQFRSLKKYSSGFTFLVEKLEQSQILVAQNSVHYMPQEIKSKVFSGITIKDNKIPYIFVAGGNHGDSQQPEGRRIFTLILLTVALARNIFNIISYNTTNQELNFSIEYDITGEILMPRDLLNIEARGLDAIKEEARRFLVTPSALTVRMMRCSIISKDEALQHLHSLQEEYKAIPKQRGFTPPPPEKGVVKYAGSEFIRRMLKAVDKGSLSKSEFSRIATLRKIPSYDIDKLRFTL